MKKLKRSIWFWLCVLGIGLVRTALSKYAIPITTPEAAGRLVGSLFVNLVLSLLFLEIIRFAWNRVWAVLTLFRNAIARQRFITWLKRRWLQLVGALAAVVGVFVACALYLPAICPECVLFHKLPNRIYVEGVTHSASVSSYDNAAYRPPDNQHIVETVTAARARVARFFGTLDAEPRVFFCITESCYSTWSGNDGWSDAKTADDKYVFLSPRGVSTEIVAHELTHAEFYKRLGWWQVRRVPIWFSEGLAVYVADDGRYLRPSGTKDRCLVHGTSVLSVTTRTAWYGNHDHRKYYGQSGCVVSRWVESHGGPKSVIKLIADMRSGLSFDQAFRSEAK